jgi:serine/threonine protein kinase
MEPTNIITERVTLVFENLTNIAPPPQTVDGGESEHFARVAKQMLDALWHLHRVIDCVHGLISKDCFVWCSDGSLKVAHWCIHLLTVGGFALGSSSILPTDISFISPEQVKNPGLQATQQSDIWSAGLALLKLLKPTCKIPDNPCRLAFCDNAQDVLQQIEGYLDDNIVWNEFFSKTLEPKPEQRATLEQLYEILGSIPPMQSTDPLLNPLVPNRFELEQDDIQNLKISEIYYLWRLSIGRNFESEQKQDDCPPILKIPCLIMNEKQSNQQTTDELQLKHHIIVDTTPKVIALDVFKADIARLDERIFRPLILTDEDLLLDQYRRRRSSLITNSEQLVDYGITTTGTECNNFNDLDIKRTSFESITFADLDNLSIKSSIQAQVNGSSKVQPIVIKESDFAYQCERLSLFKRLLAGCPYLKDQLIREASIDIPPYYRARIWAILLNVSPTKSRELYDSIDKTSPLATDRQISVDIPRCHQYNELMASPQGHQKLTRILKAWLNHNTPEYVYWQGLDSLAAPFLLLNFQDESMAFACFNAFIDKYLKGFFKKDNQLVVQKYLEMFSELLSYHDAPLANHLDKLGFLPNLYAIPWFLTMFTHVLPLHKILHVWDCLLLGDEKFPLCIGLAILNQLRQELMNYNFNDCIVAFSDLPEIDIESCIRDASHFYNSTPDKLINLRHTDSPS